MPKIDGLARVPSPFETPDIVKGGDEPIKSASEPVKLLLGMFEGLGGDRESLVLDMRRACSLSMT